jgi:hypothetical protein
MLKLLNNLAKRLWKDESGVVLAVTMIVFLSLFVMALAVYAVGDTVRLRIEVQNAADSAAYSGAIVQSDCNSRVAALNRAMSWTYVQMVRMEMDYIVDKWLYWTLKDFERDADLMESINSASSCNRGEYYYGTGYGVSDVNPLGQTFVAPCTKEYIMLNKHQLVRKSKIEQARSDAASAGKSYGALAGPIDKCRENIDAMNEKERDLINKLPKRIKKTVEEILKGNIADTWNDQFAGGGGIMYTLRQEESPLDKNFRILKGAEEDDFLRHSDYIPEQGGRAPEVFGPGSEDSEWFVRKGDGLQRHYVQRSNMLIAQWNWFSSVWAEVDGVCVGAVVASGGSSVKGNDPRVINPDRYTTTALAEPQVLKDKFFAKGGAIIVGVTRKVNNPFQFMAEGGELGIVRPFTLDKGGQRRYMWTATAAIAGYNPKPRQDCQGKYEVTYEDNSGDKLWNLKTSDWDAELIPLHRAWAKGTAGRVWAGTTAGEILNDVKGGPWVPLYGGGGALGAQGAPKGMNEGAEVAYGGAEGWVVH